MKIGFIGGGNMTEAMLKGMTSRGMRDILISEPDEQRRTVLQGDYGVETTPSNQEAAASCDIIIIAVKPQIIDGVLDEISAFLGKEKTVVSIAAGITLNRLTSKLKTRRVIRVMPNTPALVQEGMSVISACKGLPDNDISIVHDILASIGKVISLPEKHMDAVTAVSGSGPAFIACFIEAVIKAGTDMGLSENDTLALAVQTLLGTSRLIESGMSPARLREMVTSPGGTTAEGLKVLDEKGFNEIVASALKAAAKKSEELGK